MSRLTADLDLVKRLCGRALGRSPEQVVNSRILDI